MIVYCRIGCDDGGATTIGHDTQARAGRALCTGEAACCREQLRRAIHAYRPRTRECRIKHSVTPGQCARMAGDRLGARTVAPRLENHHGFYARCRTQR